MRSKYLKKLLELVKEMSADYADDELDTWSKDLLRVLQRVLVAFWFFQIDDLSTFIAAWQMVLNRPVVEDTIDVVENFLLAEEMELASAVAVSDMPPPKNIFKK